METGQDKTGERTATPAEGQKPEVSADADKNKGKETSSKETMVPLAVVRELRDKNRALEATNAEIREQNLQILAELQKRNEGGEKRESGEASLNENDQKYVRGMAAVVLEQLKPFTDKVATAADRIESQDREMRARRAEKIRADIADKNPIFKAKVFGRLAKHELDRKMAEYAGMGIRANPFEVAEEISAAISAEKAEYEQAYQQELVEKAKAAKPGAGAGAAVKSGSASGPTSGSGLPPAKNLREAATRYKEAALKQE